MSRLPPPLTLLLMLGSLAVAALTNIGENERAALPFLISLSPPRSGLGLIEVTHGEVWRLITPILLHFGPTHLIFNMIWLYDLGGQIERRIGSTLFTAFIIGAAVVSNLAQYYFVGPAFGGMSGVVYALFGYVLVHVLAHMRTGQSPSYDLSPLNMIIMICWFIACWAGVLGRVANHAHAGGLVAGLALGLLSLVVSGGGTVMKAVPRPDGPIVHHQIINKVAGAAVIFLIGFYAGRFYGDSEKEDWATVKRIVLPIKDFFSRSFSNSSLEGGYVLECVKHDDSRGNSVREIICTVLSGNVKIHDLLINRGNCQGGSIAFFPQKGGYAGQLGLPMTRPTVALNFGDQVMVVGFSCASVKELSFRTSRGDQTIAW